MSQKGLQRSELERVVRQFLEKIEKLLDSPVEMILFGSYARGEATSPFFQAVQREGIRL